jgi:ferritin-like metal-binding protein YciE
MAVSRQPQASNGFEMAGTLQEEKKTDESLTSLEEASVNLAAAA